MSAEDTILIVGGGLGGLAAALALGRGGRRVRVLEEAPELGAIGYGIQLGPNVFPMFEHLGVGAAVLRQADAPPAVVMLDALDGTQVARIPTGETFRRRFTHPYVVIHRIDLHNVLLDACKALPNIALEASTGAAGIEDHGDHIRVRTRDGRVIAGAAVIGADGLGSCIRSALRNEGPPRPIGYVAHRTIVPMERVPPGVPRAEVVLWGGPGCHIVHYPLRHGTVFNIVAVFRTSTYGSKGDVRRYREELERTYRDAQPAMRALLELMDLERRWTISDRDPIRNWHQGRAVLLGDAAHPTLQSLAQGACMAIEDAVSLAQSIVAAGGDFTAAFARYEAARVMRTARVQLESRSLWEFYHAADIARDVRSLTVADWTEQHMFDCLAWLYDGPAEQKATVLKPLQSL
ncbi:MAG TPA: FAD-dependent monooxygenase [Xanthobacteraceae bacterium]|jgi:salicylate hydroxylase